MRRDASPIGLMLSTMGITPGVPMAQPRHRIFGGNHEIMWQAGAPCNLAAYQPPFHSTIEHHTYEIRLRALSVSRRDLVRASPPARPMPLCWGPAQRALPISTDAAGVLPPARPRRVIDPGGAARAGARQRIRDNAAGLVDPDRLSAP